MGPEAQVKGLGGGRWGVYRPQGPSEGVKVVVAHGTRGSEGAQPEEPGWKQGPQPFARRHFVRTTQGALRCYGECG